MLGQEQPKANKVVSEAVGHGLNYFDVAPSYGDGEGARAQLETSLKRLKTDHFDLYQFHAVKTPEEAKQIMGPGGAGEVFTKAKKDRVVRYIGFSAHGVEAAKILMDGMRLDSVLFPVNYVNYAKGDFGPQILAEANGDGLRIAIQTLELH